MTQLDLRPLTMGEILDRTFSLFRRHFLLFLGLTAIPQVILLGFRILQVMSARIQQGAEYSVIVAMLIGLAALIATLAVYVVSQGATITAVSELYLGRTASIASSLKKIWGELGSLLGVLLLNGLAIGGATLLLIIPGIYVTCRLFVCVPAAVVEGRGPRESLSRSFDLTRDNAIRAFVILLVFLAINFAIAAVIQFPILFELGQAHDPAARAMWAVWAQVAQTFTTILVQPVLLIATSIFYFDLRVRKEGFDLQFLLDPTSERRGGPTSGSVPSIL